MPSFVVLPHSGPTGLQKLPCPTSTPPSEREEHTVIATDLEAESLWLEYCIVNVDAVVTVSYGYVCGARQARQDKTFRHTIQ